MNLVSQQIEIKAAEFTLKHLLSDNVNSHKLYHKFINLLCQYLELHVKPTKLLFVDKITALMFTYADVIQSKVKQDIKEKCKDEIITNILETFDELLSYNDHKINEFFIKFFNINLIQ